MEISNKQEDEQNAIKEKCLFFSIIVPTYNRANFIEKTLRSVLNQKYQNFEIIVVDDGSKDNTREIVTNIKSDKIRYFWKENGERGAARNYGMKYARGDYITFLDSDDLLYPNYLSNATESIQKYGMPKFFHLGYEITDINLRRQIKVNNLKNDDKKFLIVGNPLSCIGVFMHKSIIQDFQFREDRRLAGSEDWELWLRIVATHGIKVDNRISAALINHEERSVLNYQEDALIERKTLALDYAFQDARVQEIYGKDRKRMEAYFESYVALHLVLSNKNKLGLKHLWKCFRLTPQAIFHRRTLAIFKHLFFNVLRIRLKLLYLLLILSHCDISTCGVY
ncbi:MAG: glycosyltransferase [Microscillaceae bacterium]|nr:glycosyltransferase [Microscillaceae bacterium]MDW8460831.1 glycosyltransferase family 2 protein [Cytophagales bacterium]